MISEDDILSVGFLLIDSRRALSDQFTHLV